MPETLADLIKTYHDAKSAASRAETLAKLAGQRLHGALQVLGGVELDSVGY